MWQTKCDCDHGQKRIIKELINKLLLNVLILLFIFVIVRYLTYREMVTTEKKNNLSALFSEELKGELRRAEKASKKCDN